MKRSPGFLLLTLFLLWACQSGGGDSKGTASMGDGKEDVERESKGRNEGEKLYVRHCGSCHQRDGSGVPGMYPPLRGTKTVQGDKEKLIRIVLEGVEGEIEVKGRTYDQPMPAQPQLSNEELARILSYIRSHFGNEADAVSSEEVKEWRKKAESGDEK